MSVAAVILNGGQSKRMGQDKSQLRLKGQTLIDRAQQLLRSAGQRSVYISGPEGISDEQPNAGPLSGIYSSLKHLSEYKYVLFVPVDMPLIRVEMIQSLSEQTGHELVHFDGEFFPMMLQNSLTLRNHLQHQLSNGYLAIHQLMASVDSKPLC